MIIRFQTSYNIFMQETLKDDYYSGQKFTKLVVTDSDLTDKEFTDCTFTRCDFSNSDFSVSVITDCTFIDCNLSNIIVKDTSFRSVIFDSCKLMGIIFGEIDTFLLNWAFKNCRIELCTFNGLKMPKTPFVKCQIHETDYNSSQLTGSSFAESDLASSNILDCDLQKVNFTQARNYYINPLRNKLTGARFNAPEVINLLSGFGIEIED